MTAGSQYRADIDGLRAFAVLAVVMFHSFPGKLPGGFMGVDVFFVISGFLITGIITTEIDRGAFTYRNFYSRRIRRLFPALIFMLVAVAAASWFVLVDFFYARLSHSITSAVMFGANIYFMNTINYFSPYVMDRPLLHLWSLGVEEQFYLIWPLVIGLTGRYVKRHRFLVCGAIAVVSYIVCLYYTLTNPAVAFYSPLTRFWELMIGGMLAVMPTRPSRWLVDNAITAVGLALLLVAVVLLTRNDAFPALGALPAVLGAALIIGTSSQTLVGRLLSFRPIVFVGLVSYPLYLWHWPLLSLAYFDYDRGWPPNSVRIGLLVAAFVLATGTYLLIEKPLRKTKAIYLAIAMFAVFVGSFVAPLAAERATRAVELNPRTALIGEYAELHQSGLKSYYRAECDIFGWDVVQVKDSIASSCTAATAPHMALLWGDSHAQALSFGLRKWLPQNLGLAQVASSGCPPALPSPSLGMFASLPARGCQESNALAWQAIERLRPRYVFIAQSDNHDKVDWERIATRLRSLGVAHIVLIGPLPQWLPSLPSRLAPMAGKLPERWAGGLDPAILAIDATMRKRQFVGLTYFSLIERLCNAQGCLATRDGKLMAVDYGHLSPIGSDVIGKVIVGGVVAGEKP